MIRKARAIWRGTGRVGGGKLSTESAVLAETPYSFRTRFENEKGTNPEELIAAAHAGCFSMTMASITEGAHPRSSTSRQRSRLSRRDRDFASATRP
jgi:OsmC subfamily peroxiredoxin